MQHLMEAGGSRQDFNPELVQEPSFRLAVSDSLPHVQHHADEGNSIPEVAHLRALLEAHDMVLYGSCRKYGHPEPH